METIKIGDEFFHPCSIDIMQHKVVSIRQFNGFNHYVLKATHNIGACGKLEVIIDEHKGKFRFVELIDEENIEHARGLQDFIEGDYYRTLDEARIVFYDKQRTLYQLSVYDKERILAEAKRNLERVEAIIKQAKASIEERKVESTKA